MVKLSTSHSFQCNNGLNHNGGNNGNGTEAIFLLILSAANLAMKINVVFMVTLKNKILTDDIWIYDGGACGHHCRKW
jgi:hypothetical protein